MLTLSELADFITSKGIPCTVEGDGGVSISAVATLEDAGEGQISFLSNPNMHWQRRSLAALSCFAVDLVSIET